MRASGDHRPIVKRDLTLFLPEDDPYNCEQNVEFLFLLHETITSQTINSKITDFQVFSKNHHFPRKFDKFRKSNIIIFIGNYILNNFYRGTVSLQLTGTKL